MLKNANYACTAEGPRRTDRIGRASQRTLSAGVGAAIIIGLLSQVAADPGPTHARTETSTVHTGKKHAVKVSQKWKAADVLISHYWLNLTDPQELRSYAPIFESQVPYETAMFPDLAVALVLEPDLVGLLVTHEAERDPWNGNKEPLQYSEDSVERLTNSQNHWTQYTATYRTIATLLDADNAAYPSTPRLFWESRPELGSEHVINPGRNAYSPDAPGNVATRDRAIGHDVTYVASMMQRAQIVLWAEDKMAQAFLSPLYSLPDRDVRSQWASEIANQAANPWESRILTTKSSRVRGALWREGDAIYRREYRRIYHAML